MQKFESNFGLKCAEVTGDTSVSLNDMADADVILSTPEKWDSGAHFVVCASACCLLRDTHLEQCPGSGTKQEYKISSSPFGF